MYVYTCFFLVCCHLVLYADFIHISCCNAEFVKSLTNPTATLATNQYAKSVVRCFEKQCSIVVSLLTDSPKWWQHS